MTQVTVVINKEPTNIGTVEKDGVIYDVRETNTLWKIKSKDVSPQLEIQFSKKDISTAEELMETIGKMGYIKKEII